MIIKDLLINNLRIHKHSEFNFGDNINVLHGFNGSGKTTVLEAISLCSLTKSFLPVSDASLVNYDSDSYFLKVNAKSDLDLPYHIKIEYKKSRKKAISGTDGDHLSPKDIIGNLPVVILSPDFKSITFGSPSDRREFLDKILSQSSKRYIDDYLKMKRSLKQRNNLLSHKKNNHKPDKAQLEAWTGIFIETSASVTLRRHKFVNEFRPYFLDYYGKLSNGNEKVDLQYKPDSLDQDMINKAKVEDVKNYYHQIWYDSREEEFLKGTTQFGPQKDDLKIILDRGIAKDVASQGQHKTLLISLKFAEFNFLKDKKNETPVFIFDDIFAELDQHRSAELLKLLSENKAQTFLTVTDLSLVKGNINEAITNFINITK